MLRPNACRRGASAVPMRPSPRMPARLPENLCAGAIRPCSQRPARTKRSASTIRRQAQSARITPRSATSSYSTGVVVTTMPRSLAALRSVVSSPTPMIAQISRFGSASIMSADSPDMALVIAPRTRPATGRTAAIRSASSHTLCTVNSCSSASSTNGRCTPIAAISTDILPPSAARIPAPDVPTRGPSSWTGRAGASRGRSSRRIAR